MLERRTARYIAGLAVVSTAILSHTGGAQADQVPVVSLSPRTQTIQVGQTATLTATAVDDGRDICADGSAPTSWGTTVPTAILTPTGRCTATVQPTQPGKYWVIFRVETPAGVGFNLARIVVTPAQPPPTPGGFDPNFKPRAGRFDCYVNGSPTGFAFSVDLTSPTTYSIPASTTDPLGSGAVGNYSLAATDGVMTFASGPLTDGFLGGRATRADETTSVVFELQTVEGIELDCFARTS